MSQSRARRACRFITAPIRALPNFLIVGAQKGGTTSLYGYLTQHWQVVSAEQKELHFFNNPRSWRRGVWWYRSYFPLRFLLARCGRITGEATPGYMFYPGAVEHAARLLPAVKVIALLRDPVDRAFSQYQMDIREQKHALSFAQALRKEEELCPERDLERMLWDTSAVNVRFSYKARGLYAPQVQRLYGLFPKPQILILCSEEFFADPAATMVRVCTFLEIEQKIWSDFSVWHPGEYEDRMPTDIRAELARYFQPHNRRLYELVGRDFGWQS